jgi:putative ABC transport system permease protein
MTWLAVRNLFQNPLRLTLSVGGVALAFLLMLSLDAVFTGVERQITAYIDYSNADVWVSQSGVRNMHMASSSLPAEVMTEVEAADGVESVIPVLYVTNVISVNDDRYVAYIIGVPDDAQAGGAWDIVDGHARPAPGEAIVDLTIAQKTGLGVGDTVEILGRDFEIGGLTAGTANLVNSVAFISLEDFSALRGSPDTISFVLVQTAPGAVPEEVAARIEDSVNDVTALTTVQFAEQERQTVKDMSTDVITTMNFIGFLIGLAVTALTVYTATLARRAEYGVLKALGARSRDLYRTVLAQALISVSLGFLMGLIFTLGLSWIIPRLASNLALAISGESLLRVGLASLVIGGASALLPIRQIAGLDPALVFRK